MLPSSVPTTKPPYAHKGDPMPDLSPVTRGFSTQALSADREPDEVHGEAPFRNELAEFIYVRTYSRWVDGEQRRETWGESVARYFDFIKSERPNIPADVLGECHAAVLAQEVMPSMRALWSAGEAARRDNTSLYNCSFHPIDNLRSFSELLHVLMCGTGCGFSVEQEFIQNLPPVANLVGGKPIPYTIADSTEGWADALYFGMLKWWTGYEVEFDYSQIRKKGSVLKVKGGRASGPEPLRKLMDFAQETVLGAAGRDIKSVECHDICCQIAEIVMVGGFRRAALISISSPDDLEMRHAKDWSQGSFPEIRYMSNNSSYWLDKPEPEVFWKEWEALVRSKSGERGFLIDNWGTRADRAPNTCRTNPCAEISLRFERSTNPWTGEGGGGSFCNLTAAIMRPEDTFDTMAEKVRLATWLGAIQASFTHFPYLRKSWTEISRQDCLLGVDITGQCDNPALSQDWVAMKALNQVALDSAAEATAIMDLPLPVAITCGKPSGNSSQLLDCASGFHPRYSEFYFRHVRIASSDPLFAVVRDQGVPCFKENGQGHLPDDDVTVWVVRFPVKAPKHALLRDGETALEQLERYLGIMRTWCSERGHNQSATIYVHDHEWQDVGQWVYDHFDEVTGLSFLPHDGGNYTLAPYEEISEVQYLAAVSEMPNIDYSVLSKYEQEDRGGGSQELACVGGACSVDWSLDAEEAGKVGIAK